MCHSVRRVQCQAFIPRFLRWRVREEEEFVTVLIKLKVKVNVWWVTKVEQVPPSVTGKGIPNLQT